MITICIPIFNQDITALVDTVIAQCEAADVQFQLLCFDDGSDQYYKEINAGLSLKLNVNYTELSENVGRAKIRNKMAKLARYDFMLFLDGDSGIERDDFMQKYIDLVYKQSIVYGGRYYQKEKPDKDRVLHWKYGSKVESKKLAKRAVSPYQSFLTNNFMVTAKVMHEFPFDQNIASYGYEDLEWAERIKEANIFIFHIDNPTIHLGIETNEDFVKKTKKGIINLVSLYKEEKIKGSKLIDFYKTMLKFKLLGLVKLLFSKNQEKRELKLIEGRGSLMDLQVYKLVHFLKYV